MKGKNKLGFLVPVVLVVLVLFNGPLSSLSASVHTAHLAGARSPVLTQRVLYTGDQPAKYVAEVLVAAIVVLAVVAVLATQDSQFEKSKSSRPDKAALAHAEFDR